MDMKNICINTYKTLIRRFCADGLDFLRDFNKVEVVKQMSFIEDELHEKYGMDWDEIEAIEISIMKQY